MDENKDYLSSLMGEEESDKLESFQEEKVEKINKPKFHINPIVLAVILVVIAALSIGSYFLFFAPKIVVPDFVGKSSDEITTWVKQNDIEKSKVALNEEYSLEYDDGIVIDQSKPEGSKVKKNTALTFTVSKGADPDEKIDVPDLESMTSNEIKQWISDNKLSKTKVNSQYSTQFAEGSVISVTFKDVERSEFTRGDTLTIVTSKGPEPAGTVSVSDFVGKTYSEVETWAKSKKVNLEKIESFSSTVASGNVISQSVASGELIKNGETLTVTVSKGEGITLPNLVGYDATMYEAWKASIKGLTIVPKNVYSEELEGTVVAQDIPAGTTVGEGDVLIVSISAYLPILQNSSNEWYGKDYVEIQRWADKVNAAGADIQTGEYAGMIDWTCSDLPQGQIIEYACKAIDGSDLANGCDRPLPTNARIYLKVSSGVCSVTPTTTEDTTVKLEIKKFNNAKDLNVYCLANNITLIENVKESDGQFYSSSNYYIKDNLGNKLKESDSLISGHTYVIYTEDGNQFAGD